MVIRAFRADVTTMQARAASIRSLLLNQDAVVANAWEIGDLVAEEGGVLERWARTRERSKPLRDAKISISKSQRGNLACEICGFDFHRFYGELGADFAEVHHLVPLHVAGPSQTSLDDLVILCSNCHRMCHRNAWLSTDAVRAAIQEAAQLWASTTLM
ncbi:HNH endonuclease [Leifsonia sp. PS1209]|uniref:HNH endonuclease n=1 Tax=Leifsonia sp. PS1209 TaxID=2724914 RepID=UPI001442D614|nr:HNH endonuclease [Leifsonia sp. PS1209]QIZ99413.1 hypothetical protein HF024_13435 [Leifsonia sp. PS1209]